MLYPATKPNGKFTQVLNAIIHNEDLSDGAFRMYSELKSHQWNVKENGKTKYKNSSFYGLGTIAEEMGRSKRTIREHLNELDEVGLLIKVQRGGGKTNKYYLFQPFTGKGQELSYKLILNSILANLTDTEEGVMSKVDLDTLMLASSLKINDSIPGEI